MTKRKTILRNVLIAPILAVDLGPATSSAGFPLGLRGQPRDVPLGATRPLFALHVVRHHGIALSIATIFSLASTSILHHQNS